MQTETQNSLLLVTVDCLRADHTGFMGYNQPTTPFLDSIAKESLLFPAAVVGGAPTYYSLPSILASRYPLSLGRDLVGLAPGEPNLASILREAGFATAAFCAGNPYISARFGYDQGFDTFEDFMTTEASHVANEVTVHENGSWMNRLNRGAASLSHKMGLLGATYDELYFQYCQRWASPVVQSIDQLRRFPSADVLVNRALSWLASVQDRPFFLWLHFMDPHSPYYPTREALHAMNAAECTPSGARYENCFWNRGDLDAHRLRSHKSEIMALYDAGIRWVDTQLALLIQALQTSSRWGQCVLAFTADHGEEFLDHGGRYHAPSSLYEELLHVPLLLRIPGVAAHRLPDAPFSLLHLSPTLLDILGVVKPSEFQGNSLWPQVRHGTEWDTPAIAESVADCTNPLVRQKRLGPRVLAVRDRRFKLILYFDTGRQELFDLESDPSELSPLSTEAEKPTRKRLLEIAHEHLKRSASQWNWEARLKTRLRELQLEWSASPRDQQIRAS
jgi:arylsulfatase A-like enzyme